MTAQGATKTSIDAESELPAPTPIVPLGRQQATSRLGDAVDDSKPSVSFHPLSVPSHHRRRRSEVQTPPRSRPPSTADPITVNAESETSTSDSVFALDGPYRRLFTRIGLGETPSLFRDDTHLSPATLE